MRRIERMVLPEDSEARADRALRRLFPDVPAWQLREALKRKDVKINGTRIAPDAMVRPGDAMCVFLPDGPQRAPKLDIVMEDDQYLILNKQQGIPVQGAGSLEALCTEHAKAPVYACHRLDVQTGGLLLLAKTEEALGTARDAIACRKVHRFYHARVCGRPEREADTLIAYLKKDAAVAKVYLSDKPRGGYVPIETRYRLVHAEGDTSLLEVELITGKTHQIRAHLAHVGLPIVGDDKYGDRALNRLHGKRRQCLWAVRLVLWDGRAFEARAEF